MIAQTKIEEEKLFRRAEQQDGTEVAYRGSAFYSRGSNEIQGAARSQLGRVPLLLTGCCVLGVA